ncbi:hypothetical protein EP331_04850 [bacterium]|nr:MAG: hypothetical protein EP331_04850 [bacterium]
MNQDSEKKFEYLFRLELRGKPIPESAQDKISVLNKRRKKVQLLMLFNFLFVAIFYASYQYGYTNLGPNWLIALSAVFVINILLQFKQSISIKDAIQFYSKN